ncbi:cytidine deaminase [Haloarchaeobius sp. HRN-SO-5]|uniref:cytidine deaminase n=1 Tax=Haloarchaeobius sp. HRN-SO-5 TaxID=3446118 RepID=UPI003EBF0FA4
MDARPLYAADQELVEEAVETLEARFDPDRHRVASALRTGDGTVYTAVNLRSTVDQATVHCEPITLENALADGNDSFDCSVAVRYRDDDPTADPVVISACGCCRELLYDYDETLDVVVRLDGDRRKVALDELLPARA